MTYHFSEYFLNMNPELRKALNAPPASKYHNTRAVAAGLRFQSGHEAARAATLILLEKQQKIFALRFQVRFPLPGATVYVADFVYCCLVDGRLTTVVEDAKGFRTKEYKLKSKLFLETYKISITEV